VSLNVGKKSPIVVLATINGNDSSITGFIREGDCSCKPIVARRLAGFNTDRYKTGVSGAGALREIEHVSYASRG